MCLIDEYTSLFNWRWESYDKFYGLLNELRALLTTRYQLIHEVKLLKKIAATFPTFHSICTNAIVYREVKFNCVTTDVLCSMEGLLSLGTIEKNVADAHEIMSRTITSCGYIYGLHSRSHSTTPSRMTRRVSMKQSKKKLKTGLLSKLEHRTYTRF